jgi:hypothetical protein
LFLGRNVTEGQPIWTFTGWIHFLRLWAMLVALRWVGPGTDYIHCVQRYKARLVRKYSLPCSDKVSNQGWTSQLESIHCWSLRGSKGHAWRVYLCNLYKRAWRLPLHRWALGW